MSETASPYATAVCAFCKRSSEDGPKHTAGYSRYEQYARVGPLFDACQACAEKPYEQPPQFPGGNNE